MKTSLIRIDSKTVSRNSFDIHMAAVQEAFLKGNNPDTIRSDKTGLKIFAEFLGVSNFQEVVHAYLAQGQGNANMKALEFKNWLIDQKKAPATINKRLSTIAKLAKAFRFNGSIPWTIETQSVKVEAYRDTSGPGIKVLSEAISSLKDKQDPMSVRDRAILTLLHDGGLRRGELVSIDLEHIDFTKHVLWIKAKKRLQRVAVRMGSEMELAIRVWLELRGDKPGPLFTNLDRAGKGSRLTGRSVSRICEKRGVGHAHGLRHLSVTEFYRETKDIMATMTFARHTDPKTTMAYIDNLNKMASDAPDVLAGIRKKAEEKK